MKIILLIILASFLVACSTPEKEIIIKTRLEIIEPPIAARYCPEAPIKPSGNYTQADVADFIINLRLAFEECKISSRILNEYIEEVKDKLETKNQQN